MTLKAKKINCISCFLLGILMIAALLILASCSKTNESSGKIMLKDLAGREVSFDKPADRIIALAASDCEVLYAIGAQDKIIGRGTYCDYPAEVQKIKDYGSGELMNLEEVIAAKPDVVLMSKTGFTIDQVNAIENAGIKTLVNEANSLNDTYKYIEMLGILTDNMQNANNLITEMKTKIADIQKKANEKKTKVNESVYFEVSPLQYGLWTAGTNTFMDEASVLLSLKNIFSDLKGWAEISQEQVISRNPSFIVSVSMYDGTSLSPDKEIMSRNSWSGITAVKNKNIMWVDNNSITRPGPRLVDAIESMYKFIYEGH